MNRWVIPPGVKAAFKILYNLVEELKSDMETIQNEITTKNRETELEKSISTFLMT